MNNHAKSALTRPTGSTFSHINARQSCLRGRVVSGTRDHITMPLRLKAEICIKEVKINSAKPTVIESPRKTKRRRGICTFEYSIRVMNNHAGLFLVPETI